MKTPGQTKIKTISQNVWVFISQTGDKCSCSTDTPKKKASQYGFILKSQLPISLWGFRDYCSVVSHFYFRKLKFLSGFCLTFLLIFSVKSCHNLPLGILIPFGSLSVGSGASPYGVNLWCQDGPWRPVACLPGALWSSCWLVLCVPKGQEAPVSVFWSRRTG